MLDSPESPGAKAWVWGTQALGFGEGRVRADHDPYARSALQTRAGQRHARSKGHRGHPLVSPTLWVLGLPHPIPEEGRN